MHRLLTHEERVQQNQQYFKQLLKEIKPKPYVLNVKLANNPFLRSEDKFQFIVYHLNEYNKRIEKQQVTDSYEMLSYQKLHSMISDLAQFDTKQDQLKSLNDIHQWYKQQSRLIEQRRDQGQIRYQMTKDYRHYVQEGKTKNDSTNQQIEERQEQQIPSQLIARLMQPYYFGNRTSHKEMEVPIRRLNQYKRKVINIAPFIEGKQTEQPPRVLYPMPPKYEPKQEQQDVKQGQQGQQNREVPLQGQLQGQSAVEGQQKKEEQNQPQPEQDLGGFGEQPEQPEQQQPSEDTEDKLAPRNKPFTAAVTNITSNDKPYKGQYMYFRGRQNHADRSLQMRYLKLQQQLLIQQREDKFNIELTSQRARKKSKMVKDIQKKLQDMTYRPNYKFSLQQHPAQQKLSKEDQLRFGFTTNIRVKPKLPEIDISNQTLFLPKIRDESFNEKDIRRQRIKSLKSKFSKLLNLSEYEQREAAPSMCQYTARKRGFSEIIKTHSKSKQRLNQLDEVTRIKERLTRNKIGVNIRALSQGLCLPDSEENSTQPPQNMFPNKQLPSNPFMVETKKKKKKKK